MSGDLQINTPQALVQCQNVTILWTGGVGPYYVGYIASGSIQSTDSPKPAVAFRTDQMSREWQCDIAAGVEISLSVRDSNGQMVYSSPSTVQNSTDITCLPGYVPPDPSSSGLSGGAIGGIVGGVVGGLLILAAILTILWRRKRRHRNRLEGYSYRKEKEPMEVEEQGQPKVEPYLGMGEVDLGPRLGEIGDDHLPMSGAPTTTGIERPTGELERETKQMLGVTPTTDTGSASPSTSSVSPIQTKSSGPSRPTPTETANPTNSTTSHPSPHGEPSPTSPHDSSPVRREQEVEYVRHTDGGMVQVELPPLYTDVPRRE